MRVPPDAILVNIMEALGTASQQSWDDVSYHQGTSESQSCSGSAQTRFIPSGRVCGAGAGAV